MEKELNIAAILHGKPKGVKLYDELHNIYVHLDDVVTSIEETVIWCNGKKGNNDNDSLFSYSKFGTERGWLDGLQILKPSKQMRDWSKFAWKKEDVLHCGVDSVCIFNNWENDEYTEFDAEFVTPNYSGAVLKTIDWTKVINEDTIKQHISKIEEIKGGKLNLSTLEIEHPKPKFKDGDIVFKEDGASSVVGILKEHKFFPKSEGFVLYAELFLYSGVLLLNGASYKISVPKIRPATDSEKQQLFDALAKEGKAWDKDKKMLVDLPKKCEFKPFDKVLVRDTDAGIWMPTLFGFYDKEFCNYVCLNDVFQKCIPYNEETKHLLGTTDEWKGGEG